ncbi:MAG: invasion associated locus B family protein [Alphaproteobacteria bacterium]
MTTTSTQPEPRLRAPGLKSLLPILLGVAIAVLLIAVGSLGTIVMQHVNRTDRNEVTIVGFDDWRVICPPVKDPGTGCMLNMDVSRDTGETLLRFSLTATDPNPTLRITVPHGVLLDQGLGISVSGVDMKVRPYETCDTVGCVASMVLDEQTLNALKSNQQAQIVVVPGNGTPVSVPFSLKGFAVGYEELESANASREFWGFLN